MALRNFFLLDLEKRLYGGKVDLASGDYVAVFTGPPGHVEQVLGWRSLNSFRISMGVLSYDKQSRMLVRARGWVGITVRSTATRPYMPDRCQRYGSGRVGVNVSNQRGWDYGATYRVRFHRHLRMPQASNANRLRPRRSVGWEGSLFRRRHDEGHYVQRKFQRRCHPGERCSIDRHS